SATEIVIEFCQAGRGDEPAGVQIVERIVLLPLLAAELHGMLGESLQQHLQLVGAGAPADGN
ncbi:MAG: hypothetical protein JNJ60_02515, partial [Rhodocyclaceae bacterium]|nr:hypothetical protein [Rhodocyclaceae bacterium]